MVTVPMHVSPKQAAAVALLQPFQAQASFLQGTRLQLVALP